MYYVTWNANRDYRDRTVLEAYRSHEPISRWCDGHGINASIFYKWVKELGYTKDGKETEKCLDLMEEQPDASSAPAVTASPVFVKVPAQVLGSIPKMGESTPLPHLPSL